MFVYWTASTVFDSRRDSGKPWFDVEETNGAGGFCDCDEVEICKAMIKERKKGKPSEFFNCVEKKGQELYPVAKLRYNAPFDFIDYFLIYPSSEIYNTHLFGT